MPCPHVASQMRDAGYDARVITVEQWFGTSSESPIRSTREGGESTERFKGVLSESGHGPIAGVAQHPSGPKTGRGCDHQPNRYGAIRYHDVVDDDY